VSKADYPYPDDEFDVPADPDAPRGVHRAPRSAWAKWWPFLAVLVLAPVLAYAAVTVWGVLNDPSTGDPGSSTIDDEAPDDTASDGTAEEPTEGTEDPGTTESEAPPAPQPVLSTPVEVLNAAGIGGLAGTQQQKLTVAGFTAVTTGNSDGAGVDDSTVFYASEDLKPTADLVAQTLGITTVTMSAEDAGDGIVVLLKSDPAG
jgi:hypothetical protein